VHRFFLLEKEFLKIHLAIIPQSRTAFGLLHPADCSCDAVCHAGPLLPLTGWRGPHSINPEVVKFPVF
ncbi:MAG: hypothetical protein ACRD4K_04705, partial [Candidatus Acidiferrales bacterium]